MENEQKDIFNLTVNAEGTQWILRFCRLMKIVLLLSILVSLVGLITQLHWLLTLDLDALRPIPLIRFRYALWPYYWITYLIIWIVQVYTYFKFSVVLKGSLNTSSESEFNRSFSYLVRSAQLAVVVLIMSLAANLFGLFIALKYPL